MAGAIRGWRHGACSWRDGEPKLGKAGKPVVQAKYTGMHALRHFFASWCINPKEKGGRELPAKVVQEWLGHSSITTSR